ncbi:allergen Tab y 5.0101 [Scaptodrosophila lebanonensis]|uniref:Allergen Tab y 5.0101 n=1 Tax=Drosophila lebanonensis TaxID=7225 RepID=A0A6J2UH65_DROLE|nr:allergen Tab y 5.0101 [Scaptodrosophila lebanonensis]
MFARTLIVCSILMSIMMVRTTDYCRIGLCSGKIKHIGCMNFGDFDESCGESPVMLKFTSQMRGQVLSTLNTFRNAIALGRFNSYKPAASMATLRWNEELAGLAKFALRRCENLEEYCANTYDFKYVSYIYGSTNWLHHEKPLRGLLEWLLTYWINDYKNCSRNHINGNLPPKDSHCKGYFTQLVQDQAAHVGCALMRRKGPTGLLQYSLLCQFSRGKVANEPVYLESSRAGSHCYAGVHSVYHGLCAPEEHINANLLHSEKKEKRF